MVMVSGTQIRFPENLVKIRQAGGSELKVPWQGQGQCEGEGHGHGPWCSGSLALRKGFLKIWSISDKERLQNELNSRRSSARSRSCL